MGPGRATQRRLSPLASRLHFASGELATLLQIDEREHELLLEVLGSALYTLHEIDTAGYEAMRQEREAVQRRQQEERKKKGG